jgi:hypothetical protein
LKLTLRIFGGLAPGLRPPPRELDAASLDASAHARLERLLGRLTPEEPAPRAPDERRYELTIEQAGECRVVRCGDSTMTEPFEAILDFLRTHGH